MQEVGTIKGAATAWISNYYLSQSIQCIRYSGCASSMSLSSSGEIFLLHSMSVLLLKWCFALQRYKNNCFSPISAQQYTRMLETNIFRTDAIHSKYVWLRSFCAVYVQSRSFLFHYMFRPKWPSSGAHVVVLKVSAAHSNAVFFLFFFCH
jgi:hypothetical protein